MNLCVQPFLNPSVRRVKGCAGDKQQYSNTSSLSNKPSSVPAEIRKLANNSSQFHILYISGLLCVQEESGMKEAVFPPSFSPVGQGPLIATSAFTQQGVGGEYRARINKCGSSSIPLSLAG